MKLTKEMCTSTEPFVAMRMYGATTVYGYGATRIEAEQATVVELFAEKIGPAHSLLVYRRTDKQVKRGRTTLQVYTLDAFDVVKS